MEIEMLTESDIFQIRRGLQVRAEHAEADVKEMLRYGIPPRYSHTVSAECRQALAKLHGLSADDITISRSRP